MLRTEEEYIHGNNALFIAATATYSEPKFACPECEDGGCART